MEAIIATTSFTLLVFLAGLYINRKINPAYGGKRIVIKANSSSDFELLVFTATKLDVQGQIENLEIDPKEKKIEFHAEKFPVWDVSGFEAFSRYRTGHPSGEPYEMYSPFSPISFKRGEKSTDPHITLF